MSRAIKCNWFAPTRQARSLAIEARHRASGWFHLVRRSSNHSMSNFGDELAPFVLSDATGHPVEWARFGREDVNVIGSNIVHYAREGGVGQIWGMGVHSPVLTEEEKARVAPKVLAIRGPNSRDHVGLSGTTPMGDPGLLARNLGPSRARKSGSRLLIGHFSAFASKRSRAKMHELENHGFEIALPNMHPLEMINKVASADFVACSGLHGTIISHALGTPVELITFSDTHEARPAYKYVDYFASLGDSPALVQWDALLESGRDRSRRIEAAEARGLGYQPRVAAMVDALYDAARPLR